MNKKRGVLCKKWNLVIHCSWFVSFWETHNKNDEYFDMIDIENKTFVITSMITILLTLNQYYYKPINTIILSTSNLPQLLSNATNTPNYHTRFSQINNTILLLCQYQNYYNPNI